ncbi:C2 family cysteine protease [Legionella sp. PC997]|uniref:C2 family cysteine protease n=1 Tax=Legionella sp. PC997 TaxID=2755562 RepID=UPI0015FD4DC4|nr:C2 family cysteine protease [Legionella sp. PC997]QMT60934.1 hypothetical protein HBNCFIEN_02323 [Legionella sp. PC997]
MLPLNFLTQGSLVVPANSSVPLVFPGVRGKIKQIIQLPNGHSLEANSLAIIQPLNLDKPEQKQRFRLTPYVPVGSSRDDLPENQRNISIDEKNSGEIELNDPSQYLEYIEQYQPSKAPLFSEGSPSIEDVRQARVPDCFLLASLAAILRQPDGASYIRSMLRQNDDGTTTVRLFNPKTLEPVYIRVENSYIVDQKGSLNNHTALWVDILEKAAASVPEFFGNTNASMSGALKGGSESLALKILTGCNSKEIYINNDKYFAWDIGNFFASELEQLKVLTQQKKLIEEFGGEHQSGTDEIISEMLSSRLRVFKDIFDEKAQEICLKLIDFYLENKDAWEKIYKECGNGQQRLEEIIKHFSQDEKNKQAVDILKELFTYYHKDVEKDVRRDNQELFSGIYSPEELKIFNDIKNKLAGNESLTAGTPHSYDEKVPGLRAMHAYTIVDVVETRRPVKDTDVMRPIKMIRIRNPWGFTGRMYLPNMENPEQIDIKEERVAGTFDLELKDFCRYYESYTSTLKFSAIRVLAEKRELLALKMQEPLKDVASDQDLDDERLSRISAFFECRADLVDIQMTAVELLNDSIHEQIADVFSDNLRDPLEVQASLDKIIEANKMTMMNLFQTSDCELIAASITYWWKNSHQELSEKDDKAYQHQILESVNKNDLLWKEFIQNYQVESALALIPLNKSQRLIIDLFASIEYTQRSLEQINPEGEGYEAFFRALVLQRDLLEQHFNYLEKYEHLLQQFDIKIDTFREQLKKINAYIEELEQNPIAAQIVKKLKDELPAQSLYDFTSNAESLLENLAKMGLVLNEYHEEDSPTPLPTHDEREKQNSGHAPEWLNSLRDILEKVLKAIGNWKTSANNKQIVQPPEYNRSPDGSKYPLLKRIGFFGPKSEDDSTDKTEVFHPNQHN